MSTDNIIKFQLGGHDTWYEYKPPNSNDVWMYKSYKHMSGHPAIKVKLVQYDTSYEYPFDVAVSLGYSDLRIVKFYIGEAIKFEHGDVAIAYRPRKLLETPIRSLYFDLAFAANGDEDIELVSSDGLKIRINRFLFMARSQVFKKMLESPMEEGKNNKVVFKEIESGVLKALVHYLKHDSLGEAKEGCEDRLVQLADMYDLPGLFALCQDYLLDKMKANDGAALDIVHIALKFGSSRLIKAYHDVLRVKNPI